MRRRERVMATTEITDAAIRATATATTAMVFRPIEGARPPEGPGWGRAFYEPSPFDITPGPARRPVVHVGQEATAAVTGSITTPVGRRRAETMPGGMIPVIDAPRPTISPAPAPVPVPVVHVPEDGNNGLFIDHDANGSNSARVDLATIAGPSRVVRNEEDDDDDAVFGFATGDEIAMDLD